MADCERVLLVDATGRGFGTRSHCRRHQGMVLVNIDWLHLTAVMLKALSARKPWRRRVESFERAAIYIAQPSASANPSTRSGWPACAIIDDLLINEVQVCRLGVDNDAVVLGRGNAQSPVTDDLNDVALNSDTP